MKTKAKLTFAKLPRDYAALCRRLLPRPIHDAVAYENALEVAEAFAGFESKMTKDQTDYFDLLSTLIADYEDEQEPDIAPLDLLKNLLDEAGLTGTDLSRILGASRQLGPMILRGERKITAEHARCLGSHFKLDPGVFVA